MPRVLEKIISQPLLLGKNDNVREQKAIDVLLNCSFLAERQLRIIASINNVNKLAPSD